MKLPLADHPGCWNRKPLATHHWVMDRIYTADGNWLIIQRHIENPASKLCRSDYDVNRENRCKNCTVEQDHEYFEEKGL